MCRRQVPTHTWPKVYVRGGTSLWRQMSLVSHHFLLKLTALMFLYHSYALSLSWVFFQSFYGGAWWCNWCVIFDVSRREFFSKRLLNFFWWCSCNEFDGRNMALKDGGGQGFVNPQPYCKQECFLLTKTDRHDEISIHSFVDGHFSSFKIILKGYINMAASAFNHLYVITVNVKTHT